MAFLFMHYVWWFNAGLADYECIGAFSGKDDAEAYVDNCRADFINAGRAASDFYATIMHENWQEFIGRVHTMPPRKPEDRGVAGAFTVVRPEARSA